MRWLILVFGLAVALVAGFALLRGSSGDPLHNSIVEDDTAHVHESQDEIDDASRERLREILRAADQEEESGR